jgi:hypothetical protein
MDSHVDADGQALAERDVLAEVQPWSQIGGVEHGGETSGG